MKMKDKIVITGACGHIGSALIRSRSLDKYNVIAVDNFLTQRYTSLFHLRNNIKFYEADFLNIDYPEGSTVIHLAAITDAASSMLNPKQLEEINITKTKQLIDKCIESKVKRFIFPSSTSVYGVAAELVNEDDAKFENPQSPYAQSKIEIEKYLESKKGEIEYIIPRFGTIFGISPGMRFHTAINKFCWQSSLNQPITVWKENYEQVRPYLGLKDCLKSIKHFINLDSGLCNTKYNVLTGNYKLSDVVEIIKTTNQDLEVKFVDTPLLNQFSYNVDDSKVKSTGFKSEESLDIGVLDIFNILKNLK
tara:strand:+ start:220 stop:1137 length:918 start_codon:yes stop_codon:yes gene_type:complete